MEGWAAGQAGWLDRWKGWIAGGSGGRDGLERCSCDGGLGLWLSERPERSLQLRATDCVELRADATMRNRLRRVSQAEAEELD